MSFSSGHALVIGIGSYPNIPGWNVPITVKDAEAISGVLLDPQRAGYEAGRVKLLRDAETTRQNVLAELARLAADVGEEDTLVLFYCGHGAYSEDGTYHLSTHDTRLTAARKIEAGTAVSQQELIEQLRNIKAKRVLLLLNACHSGELSPALGEETPAGQPVPASTTSALLSTGDGRIVITACKEDQLSYIGSGELTRFTGALVEGLSGRGDVTNRNGFVSAYDLYLHTYYKVHDLAERFQQQQEPELTVLKSHGPFAVALYRGASTLGAFDESEAPPAEGAVREVRPERSLAAFTVIMGNQVSAGRDAAGRDLRSAGRDYIEGDQIDARGAQGLINRPSGPISQTFDNRQDNRQDHSQHIDQQRNIDTGGGDYSEVDIDKRQGAFVSGGTVYGPVTGTNDGTINTNYGEQNTTNTGDNINIGNVTGSSGIAIGRGAQSNVSSDQYTFSGNFDNSILNVKSTLSDVVQTTGAASGADPGVKRELQSLTSQLGELLNRTPPERVKDAELVANRLETLVASATRNEPDAEQVDFDANRLVRAADTYSDAVPGVGDIVRRIAQLGRKLGGAS